MSEDTFVAHWCGQPPDDEEQYEAYAKKVVNCRKLYHAVIADLISELTNECQKNEHLNWHGTRIVLHKSLRYAQEISRTETGFTEARKGKASGEWQEAMNYFFREMKRLKQHHPTCDCVYCK